MVRVAARGAPDVQWTHKWIEDDVSMSSLATEL